MEERYFLLGQGRTLPIISNKYPALKRLRGYSTYCPLCDILSIYYMTRAEELELPAYYKCDKCGHRLTIMEEEELNADTLQDLRS